MTAVPLEELPLEAEALADEALALVVDVALAVTELEAEEELDLSETLSPETELGLLVLGTGLLCFVIFQSLIHSMRILALTLQGYRKYSSEERNVA